MSNDVVRDFVRRHPISDDVMGLIRMQNIRKRYLDRFNFYVKRRTTSYDVVHDVVVQYVNEPLSVLSFSHAPRRE